jgi:hypothetical protein
LFMSKFDKIVLWMITTHHATSQNWKEKTLRKSTWNSYNVYISLYQCWWVPVLWTWTWTPTPQIWNHVAIEIVEAANYRGQQNWVRDLSLGFHFLSHLENLELKFFQFLIWEWTELVLNVKLHFFSLHDAF